MKTIIRGAFLRSVLLLAAEVVFIGATGYAHKIEWFYIKAITETRQVDSIRDTEDDVVVFQAKGKYGVRNRSTNEVIVKPKYDRISSFKNGYAEFWKGDNVGVLNDSGKEYLKAKYKEIVFPPSGMLVKASPLFVVSEKGDRRYKLVSDRKSKGDEFYQIRISPDLCCYGEIAEGVWTVKDPVTCKSDGTTLAATSRDMASRMLSDDYTIFNNDIYKSITDANGCRTAVCLQDMPERKEKDLNGMHFVFDGDNLIDLSSHNDFRSYRRLIDMAGSDAKNDDLLDGIYEMNPKPLRSTVALFLVKADNMYELRIPMGYDRRGYASVVDGLKNKRKSLMVLTDGRSKSMGLFDGEKIIMPPYFSKIRLGRHKEGNDEAIVCFAVDDTLSESSEYYDKIYLAFKEAVGDRAIFYVRTPSVSRLYGWSDDPVDVEVANEIIIDNNIIWCWGDNGKTAYGRNGQLLLSGITEMTPFARDLCKIKSGDKEGIVKISKGGLTIVLPAGYDRIRQNNELISGWAQDRPAPNVLVEKDGKRGLYAEDGSE
ncbi:MAG: WG repeat-containing protein, partial [Paramuribaculum sp.]|nr:WG repeat-containing protein [Paramuribaculum sp.]